MVLSLCGFVFFTTGRFVLCHTLLFVLVFSSVLFSIMITSLEEEGAGLCASRAFFFSDIIFCPFSLPLGVRDWLWLVIVTRPGLGYGYYKLRIAFSKLYLRRYDLLSHLMWNSNLFLNKACWNLNFMVTKCINKEELPDGMSFLISLEQIVIRYIRTGYNTNVIRQTACLVVNPFTGYNCCLFNCTPAGRASDLRRK